MAHLKLPLLALIMGAVAIRTAEADILLSDDFDSYAASQAPTAPQDGNVYAWFFDPSLSVTTEDGGAPDAQSSGGKLLRVQRSKAEGNPGDTRMGRLFDAQSSGTLQLTIKFQIHNFTASQYYLAFISTKNAISEAFASTPVAIRFTPEGHIGVEYNKNQPGQDDLQVVWNPQGGPLIAGDWYELKIIANLTVRTFRVEINNLSSLSQSGSTQDLYFSFDQPDINGVLIRSVEHEATAGDRAIDWSLDDLKVETLPE